MRFGGPRARRPGRPEIRRPIAFVLRAGQPEFALRQQRRGPPAAELAAAMPRSDHADELDGTIASTSCCPVAPSISNYVIAPRPAAAKLGNVSVGTVVAVVLGLGMCSSRFVGPVP